MTEPVNINQVPKLNLGLQETDEVFITRGGAGPYRVPASSFPWQQKGDPGVPGGSWAPVLSLVTDGARRVHRIVGWVGGTGVEPTTTGYIGAAGIVSNVAEAVDVRGLQGNAGWSPVLALVADGDRRVHQVIDWTGGAGAKPGVGWYVGAIGLVELIQDAVNVRGATGGVGWSPVLAIATDGERRVQRVIDWTGGVGTKPTLAGYVGAAGIVATAAEAVDVRGAPGSASWAPVLAIVADGERLVQQVVDWTGGVGAKPSLAGYVGAAGIVATAAAAVNVRGAQGGAGWSPVLAIVGDGERRVQQVVDWVGGAGTKPAVGGYIGQAGLVATGAGAVDVRGSGVVSAANMLMALNASSSADLGGIEYLVSGGLRKKRKRAVGIGNSLVAGTNTNNAQSFVQQLLQRMPELFGEFRNAAVGGRSSAAVLAALPVDVLPGDKIAVYHEGTNDGTAASQVSRQQHLANIESIRLILLAFGCQLAIIETATGDAVISPTTTAGARIRMEEYALGERFFCEDNGLLFSSPWLNWIDQATGGWSASANVTDGSHPPQAVHDAVAISTVAQWRSRPGPIVPRSNAGAGGLAQSNVLNLVGSGQTGWMVNGAAPSASAVSAGSGQVRGNWSDQIITGLTSPGKLFRYCNGGLGVTPGDRLRIAGFFRFTNSSNMRIAARLQVSRSVSPNTSLYLFDTSSSFGEEYFEAEIVAPDSIVNTVIWIEYQSINGGANAYSGSFSFACLDVYNVTKLTAKY